MRSRLHLWHLFALLMFAGCSAPPPEDGLSKLQGDWVVLELNEKGKPADARKVKNFSVSIRGNQFNQVEADGPKLLNAEQTTLRVDASKTPGEIDFVGTKGADQGKTRLGIYAIEDTKIKICFADFGADRPTEFAGKDRSTLLVLERKP